MDAIVINFKKFESGALAGFFDLVVGGITITGCKAFRKRADDGTEKLWFGFPSEKTQDRDGKDIWKDIVTCAEPVNRYLQGLVRSQLRALLNSGSGSATGHKPRSTGQPAGEAKEPRRGFRSPEGENLDQYRSNPDDDIPF